MQKKREILVLLVIFPKVVVPKYTLAKACSVGDCAGKGFTAYLHYFDALLCQTFFQCCHFGAPGL